MTRPSGSFCWIDIATTDANRAVAFYSQLFNWRSTTQDMGSQGTYTVLHLGDHDLGGMYELRGPMFDGVPPHWMHYVAVDQLEEKLETTRALGGSVLTPPQEIPGKGRTSIIEDPEGAKLALWQATGHPGWGHGKHSYGGVGWAELNTRDPDRATAFYTGLFGWTASTCEGEMPYTEWSLPGGKQFGGMLEMGEHHGDAPPHWLGYVMVEDCAATYAKAVELGATTYVAPFDIPNTGQMAVIADPLGAVFAFIRLDETH